MFKKVFDINLVMLVFLMSFLALMFVGMYSCLSYCLLWFFGTINPIGFIAGSIFILFLIDTNFDYDTTGVIFGVAILNIISITLMVIKWHIQYIEINNSKPFWYPALVISIIVLVVGIVGFFLSKKDEAYKAVSVGAAVGSFLSGIVSAYVICNGMF